MTVGTEYASSSRTVRLRQQIADGLLYSHARLSDNTKTTLEVASFLYALVELLSERELIAIDELDHRKQEIGKRLIKKNREKGVGVLLQQPEYDKYSFDEEAEIDCQNRVHLCKAACCRLPFALSKQDIHEGVVQWDLGQPYIIAQEQDGYCSHLERDCWHCIIRKQRPVPCRAYDCRKGNKIWLDFGNHVINPDILRDDWPHCDAEESERSNAA